MGVIMIRVLVILIVTVITTQATKEIGKSSIDNDVLDAISQLNRYCGSGGYSYYRPTYGSSYYYPSNCRPTGPNLSNLITPVVFGLAAATGLGLATSAFPSTSIAGK